MLPSSQPCVVRLNAQTMPMSDEERQTLASVSPRLVEVENAEDDGLLEMVRDADAVVLVSASLRPRVIAGMKRCKIISRAGTGVDKIDLAGATRQGIIVNNLPDAFTEEVADHTLALLLAAARKIPMLDRVMRQGRNLRGDRGIHRLARQTVGIIGFGRIGRAVARRCRAFGLRVLACDPCLTSEIAEREGVMAVDLDALLTGADYVCLLCPLTNRTRGMLARPQFLKMKPSAMLVNTGRGELVNEDDLADALRDGIIQFAALDVFGVVNVFDPNGFPTDHPLFKLDNVLVTPHFGSVSAEAALESRRRAAQAVVDVLSGKWPEHPVNPEVTPWFPMPLQPVTMRSV